MRTLVGQRVVCLSIVSALVLIGRAPLIVVGTLAAVAVALGLCEVRAVRQQHGTASSPLEHDLAA